jgi:hypothetical protein
VVFEEIREKIKKFLESNENENTTFQNQWDTVKAVLRGTFMAMSAYIKKQISNNLMMYFKPLEKQEQANP